MIDRKSFFDRIRTEPFGGFLSSSQVSGISAVLDVWDKSGFTDPRWLAYCLATSYHETGKAMVGVREGGKGRGLPYGAPVPPYNLVYYGRGMCQITWARNYEAASDKLRPHGFGVDLLRNPDDALKDDVAAAILLYGSAEGWFTGRKLSTYFNATVDDPVNARRIINGIDKAALVAGYHTRFLAAILAAGCQAAPVVVAGPHAPTPELDAIRSALSRAALEQVAAKPTSVPPVLSPGALAGSYLPPASAQAAPKPILTGWRAVLAGVRAHFGMPT